VLEADKNDKREIKLPLPVGFPQPLDSSSGKMEWVDPDGLDSPFTSHLPGSLLRCASMRSAVFV